MNTVLARVDVLGSGYTSLGRARVTDFLLRSAKEKKGGYVCVSNVHTTMTGVFDSSYRKITNDSLCSVPDGVPLVWAMRLLGAPEQDRVRGPSLMRDICAEGRAIGLKHYLLGGSPKALAALEQKLQAEYPGINIVGRESPPFRESTPEEERERVEAINASGANILWVGLGAPKQERWMSAHRHMVRPLMLGVGAAFDLIPGLVPEAPGWMQSAGLEWLYRFFREPGRLWKRYIFNNPLFLLLLTLQVIRAKLTLKHARANRH